MLKQTTSHPAAFRRYPYERITVLVRIGQKKVLLLYDYMCKTPQQISVQERLTCIHSLQVRCTSTRYQLLGRVLPHYPPAGPVRHHVLPASLLDNDFIKRWLPRNNQQGIAERYGQGM